MKNTPGNLKERHNKGEDMLNAKMMKIQVLSIGLITNFTVQQILLSNN